VLDLLGTGLSCPVVRVNRPEPADLSIFIAQKIELFKEKMNTGEGRDGSHAITEMYTGIRNRL
jgi:hypothetical protein